MTGLLVRYRIHLQTARLYVDRVSIASVLVRTVYNTCGWSSVEVGGRARELVYGMSSENVAVQ